MLRMRVKMTVVVRSKYKNLFKLLHQAASSHILQIINVQFTGPMIYKENGNDTNIHRLMALVSFGFDCAHRGSPGYYAPVYTQLEWIRHIMQNTITCPNIDQNGLGKCSSSRMKINFVMYVLSIGFLLLVLNSCSGSITRY